MNNQYKNIIMIYPKYPETFWSFKYALKFISKKASYPPLGLLTVASLLPKTWQKKLIDLNITKLKLKDIENADLIFISAMSIQKKSAKEIIKLCKEMGKTIVAGGPMFTMEHQEFDEIDHLVLNEAELTLPNFLEDYSKGHAKHIYTSRELPKIENSPMPEWDLIKLSNYSSMNIQYSRGCPFNCEFCDISILFGRRVRTKTSDQIISELDGLYKAGWRGGVFFVDDNFIGNRKKLKKDILPAIISWMKEHKKPFAFNTEVSINIADDKELMSLMTKAGFDTVFVGIESPNPNSLAECNKIQNQNRDLVASIKKIQNFGLQVQGGFIIGFDNDTKSIFDDLINFIQNSGILTAMVGLLNAPRGTQLYKRLEKEYRLLTNFTGDNTDFTINFIPRMNYKTLIEGYKKVVKKIYSPKIYYKRIKIFLKEYILPKDQSFHFHLSHIGALIKSIFILGIKDKGRFYYWKSLIYSFFKNPRLLPLTITLQIYGYHFRQVFDKDTA